MIKMNKIIFEQSQNIETLHGINIGSKQKKNIILKNMAPDIQLRIKMFVGLEADKRQRLIYFQIFPELANIFISLKDLVEHEEINI